ERRVLRREALAVREAELEIGREIAARAREPGAPQEELGVIGALLRGGGHHPLGLLGAAQRVLGEPRQLALPLAPLVIVARAGATRRREGVAEQRRERLAPAGGAVQREQPAARRHVVGPLVEEP